MEFENPERQVWQRVFSQPQQKREDLRPLLLSAMESAGAFRHLAASLTGEGKEQARALHQSQMETVFCLRGLQALSGSAGTFPKVLPQIKEPASRLLEKAFYRAKAAITEYTARSLDPDFGMVFHCLAQREELHCAAIARLLGMLNGKNECRTESLSHSV